MATLQIEELARNPPEARFDIVDLVRHDTWKDLLTGLVERNRIDPWDVDIVQIVGKYISAVKAMKILDLRIPANIILAASILLRLKSEMLYLEDNVDEPIDGQIEAPIERPMVDPLSLRLRPPIKRRLTLNELIEALDEAMRMKEARASILQNERFEVPITINKINMEEEMESLYEGLRKHMDKERMLTFSYLLNVIRVDDILLKLFIPLLFLANKGRILLMQERFFDEIIISLNKD